MDRLLETAAGARVLAVGAHPDDVELGAGGLVARLARRGAQVVMAVCSVPTRPEERAAEAAEGARVLGGQLVLLSPGDATRVEEVPMHRLVARLDTVVQELRPHLVLTHSAHDLHWDHRLVHNATVSAVRRTPCDLLSYLSSPEMNAQVRSMGECFADITDTIEIKLEAIRAHRTQEQRLDVESSRDLARAMGRLCGTSYAEAYQVLRIRI